MPLTVSYLHIRAFTCMHLQVRPKVEGRTGPLEEYVVVQHKIEKIGSGVYTLLKVRSLRDILYNASKVTWLELRNLVKLCCLFVDSRWQAKIRSRRSLPVIWKWRTRGDRSREKSCGYGSPHECRLRCCLSLITTLATILLPLFQDRYCSSFTQPNERLSNRLKSSG